MRAAPGHIEQRAIELRLIRTGLRTNAWEMTMIIDRLEILAELPEDDSSVGLERQHLEGRLVCLEGESAELSA